MKRALIFFFGLLLWVNVASAQAAPDELVRKVTEQILQLIKTNRDAYARDHQKLFAMVDREVLPYFDFRVMSRSVLGRYWREASEPQRNQFTEQFRDLLVRTYATALLKYNDEEIRYLPFRASPDDKTVLVRTEVVQSGGGQNIPLNYSFYRSKDGWKVYDVSVGGVSLVTNYRSTYSEKIRREGLDKLIAELSDANRRGETAPAKSSGK